MIAKLAKVGVCAVAVVVMGACAGGGGGGVSDEEAIRLIVEDAMAALQAKDIDAMTVAYAEDFESDQGGGAAEMREFLQGAADQGFLDDVEVDLTSMVIAVDGDKATAKPIDLEGNFGALTVEFDLAKRDGQWWVVYQSQY